MEKTHERAETCYGCQMPDAVKTATDENTQLSPAPVEGVQTATITQDERPAPTTVERPEPATSEEQSAPTTVERPEPATPVEQSAPTTVERPAPATPVEQAASQAEQPAAVSREELERLIAEAEQRGYIRGRNERAEAIMAQPGLYEEPSQHAAPATAAEEIPFLNTIRRSVWDD